MEVAKKGSVSLSHSLCPFSVYLCSCGCSAFYGLSFSPLSLIFLISASDYLMLPRPGHFLHVCK